MITNYVVLKVLAAASAVVIAAAILGAYHLARTVVENHKRTRISGKPAFSRPPNRQETASGEKASRKGALFFVFFFSCVPP